MDLEQRLAQALEGSSHASTSDGSKPANKEWLPNEPTKSTLLAFVGFCGRNGEDLGLGFGGIGEDVEESYEGGFGFSV